MKKILLALLFFVMAGCTSVPLSTMIAFSSYGLDDFVTITPSDVRAKVIIDEPVKADIDNINLSVELESLNGARLYNFPLVLIEQNHLAESKGWIFDEPAKNEYILKLSKKAVYNFSEAQELIKSSETGKFSFSVNAGFAELPENISTITLSILLKFESGGEYLTIFENASLDIERED